MAEKLVTYSALKFDKGMTPKVFTPDSATRIEHFDTITEVLRPFRTLVASSHNQGGGVTIQQLALTRFSVLNDAIYGLGTDHATGLCSAIYKWNTTSFEWQDKNSLTGTNVARPMLEAHANLLWGIVNDRYLYNYNPATTTFSSMTLYDCGTIVNGFAEGVTHSKDGRRYFATDNKVHYILSDGTSPALGLTLPNSNFRITSLCEQGNFLNIVGYDVKTNESASLLWDRDTSVVDFTESYSLGRDVVVHNANIGGLVFFVQVRGNSSNTTFSEKPVLIIKVLNGSIPTTIYEFPVMSLPVVGNLIGARYTSLDRFYFTARVQFDGEASARNVCFGLDYKGRLTIAQNVAINTGTNAVTGVLRNGEGFWFGAGSDGAWNTISTYTTVASYETNDIRSEDLSMNIDLSKLVVTCEPLPASGQILVKMRKNEETTFTTIATFTEQDSAKFALTALKAKNALVGLDNARQVRIRLESTNGATITGLQAVFSPTIEATK